jgi:hypothetical protein
VALARVLAMEGRRQEAADVLKQVRRTDLTAQSARLARLFREARALAAPKTSPR